LKPTFILICTTVLICGLIGCSSGKEKAASIPENADQATQQLESAFEEVMDQNAKQQASSLAQALQEDDFQRAHMELIKLGNFQVESIEQVVAIENSNRLLQRRVLEAKEAGDPVAARVWQMMKMGKRN